MDRNIPSTVTKLTGRTTRIFDPVHGEQTSCEVPGCNQPIEKLYEIEMKQPETAPNDEKFNVSLCESHASRFKNLGWEWSQAIDGGYDSNKRHFEYSVFQK